MIVSGVGGGVGVGVGGGGGGDDDAGPEVPWKLVF